MHESYATIRFGTDTNNKNIKIFIENILKVDDIFLLNKLYNDMIIIKNEN